MGDEGREKMRTNGTIRMVKESFPYMVAIIFWFTVAGSTIGGAKVAQGLYVAVNTSYSYSHGDSYSGDKAGESSAMLLGGLLGLCGGFLIAIWTGGIAAILLTMDKNLQYLADKEEMFVDREKKMYDNIQYLADKDKKPVDPNKPFTAMPSLRG